MEFRDERSHEGMQTVSCSEYPPSLCPVAKETTRHVRRKKKELGKKEKLPADIWEEIIMTALYTLRKGTGQIISERYSQSTLTSQCNA